MCAGWGGAGGGGYRVERVSKYEIHVTRGQNAQHMQQSGSASLHYQRSVNIETKIEKYVMEFSMSIVFSI